MFCCMCSNEQLLMGSQGEQCDFFVLMPFLFLDLTCLAFQISQIPMTCFQNSFMGFIFRGSTSDVFVFSSLIFSPTVGLNFYDVLSHGPHTYLLAGMLAAHSLFERKINHACSHQGVTLKQETFFLPSLKRDVVCLGLKSKCC